MKGNRMFGFKYCPAPSASVPHPVLQIDFPAKPEPDYVAPAWVEDYLTHAIQTFGQDSPVITSLLGLHKRLLNSASAADHGSPFLDAAAVIQDLIRSSGHPAVYRDGLDVCEDTTRAVAETLQVLRDWTGPATSPNVRQALRQASAWADHVSLRVTTASATCVVAPFATPVKALTPHA
jgi:hypothetical protein